MYKVFVPYKNKSVTYPPSGHPLYSRAKAIEVMKRFFERAPWADGDERELWAESESERFTLHYPEVLV